MNDDRCYFEMDETEAELTHIQKTLEFMLYSIATGRPFMVGDCENSGKVQEINELCVAIENNMCDAIGNIDKLMELCKVENEEPAEKDKDYAEIFKELSDIKFDGEDAVNIRVETVEGQIVEMINTDNGLLCSGWKEV